MKKLLAFFMVMFVCVLMAGSVFAAASYCQDFLEPGNPGGRTTGLKTCDTAVTVNPGDTFAVDIWAADLPEKIVTSGFEMSYNPAEVSIVNVEPYDGTLPGPWDESGTFKMPDAYGPGSYVLGVVNVSCVTPDAGGDVIIAKITFQYLSGNATISVQAIESFHTTAGCTSSVIYDSEMGVNTFIISQGHPISSTTSSTDSSSTSTLSTIITSTTTSLTISSSTITSSSTISPSSTTSTTTKCLSELLYGEYADETKQLRYFRDNIFSQTTEGRALIKLYYLWNPIIVKAMEEDEQLQEEVKELIDSVLPMIQDAMDY